MKLPSGNNGTSGTLSKSFAPIVSTLMIVQLVMLLVTAEGAGI